MIYDNWKTTEPDSFEHEPVGECHWCGHRAVLYRTWLFPIETWLCDDCLEEAPFRTKGHAPSIEFEKSSKS
jgi:hypothetical protein